MPRNIPKSLLAADFHPLWRSSRRFVSQPLRILPARDAKSHFTGGPSVHKGSECPNCKKRMTLFWNLDLNDPLIPEYVRAGFAPATRLPFYICLQCVAASYAVLTDAKVKTFPFDHETDFLKADETPFQNASAEVERRPIAMTRVPTTIDALLSLADVIGHDELDEGAKRTLDAYLGEKVTTDWDLPISQFGGTPLPNQGHRNRVCPNSKCLASKLEHPYGDWEQSFLMKEMALIDWKGEPILSEHCFQLLYTVCPICFSIRAEYRCS
jgi:hypothetical protein